MTITKAKPAAAKKAAPVKKAATVKKATPAPKAAPAPKAEAPEVKRAGRKEVAELIRLSVQATGKAVPLSITEVMVGAYEEAVGTLLAAGNEVNLPGFGKFVSVHKEAGQARNPATGEMIDVAAKNTPRFKPGAKLKAAVNGGADDGADDE